MAKAIRLDAPTQFQLATPRATNRLYIGHAWNNVSGPASKNPGAPYTNIVFDKGIEIIVKDKKNNVAYSILGGPGEEGILAFPNEKRPGKKDADMNLSISTE